MPLHRDTQAALITAVHAVAAWEDDESDLTWEDVSSLVGEAITAVRRDRGQEAADSPTLFDGAVYCPSRDDERLTRQVGRVWAALSDGQWHTLNDVHVITGDPVASVSAQFRHLRKPKHGSWFVDKDSDGGGLYRYRMRNPDGTEIA